MNFTSFDIIYYLDFILTIICNYVFIKIGIYSCIKYNVFIH